MHYNKNYMNGFGALFSKARVTWTQACDMARVGLLTDVATK